MLSISFAFLLSTLGLLWIALAPTGVGGSIKYFHVAAIAFAVLTYLRKDGWRGTAQVQRRVWPFTAAVALYLIAVIVPLGIFENTYYTQADLIKEVFAVWVAFPVSAFVFGLSDRSISRYFPLVGTVTILLTVGLLMEGLIASGRDPLYLIMTALRTADPNLIIFGVFRSSFVAVAQTEDVRSNMRHGIMSGIFVAVLFSSMIYAGRGNSPLLVRVVHWSTWLATVVIILMSLSRSLILSLIAFGATLLAIRLGRSRDPLKVLLILSLACVALLGVVVSALGPVLMERLFEDTDSYTGRLSAIGIAFDAIGSAPFFPSESNVNVPAPHITILKAWIGGGLLAAIGASIMIAYVLRAWFVMFMVAIVPARWPLKNLEASCLLGIGLIPIVRFFTAGSGVNTVQEWVALGIFLGGWAAFQNARRKGVIAVTPRLARKMAAIIGDSSLATTRISSPGSSRIGNILS